MIFLEKYEINKFIEESNKRVNDIFEALKIKEKKDKQLELKKKIDDPNFWSDPDNAKKIIEESNNLSSDINSYDAIYNQLETIKETLPLALEDSDVMTLLEDEIKSFLKAMDEIEIKALLSNQYDENNCILDFHPGAGGTESMDWALMLFRMYQRFASKNGYSVDILNYEIGDEAGIKSASILIKGRFAYGYLKSEAGVHRLVRISPFDSNKRRHTSFCSIDVSPEVDDNSSIEIKEDDIRIDTYLASGHGGQGVNTTYSAVRITHKPTNIVVTCQNERSQLKNKEICLRVLKSKLLELEIKKQEEEMRNLKGTQMSINFGSQIRSYVFTPYTLVKDHRTNYEMTNVNAVMDGDIINFSLSYLKYLAQGE